MPNFANGKIYKITGGDETYYGSTAQTLEQRIQKHKGSYKRWKNKTGSNCMSFTIFDKYGFDNCPIELVEAYPCETKKELLIREDWYIKTMECINKNSAYSSREENLEKRRQYHQDNKEEIKEKKRQYRQDHKEEIKQYRQDNKKAISEKNKEKIVCECGREYRKCDIARHRRTAFHLANI